MFITCFSNILLGNTLIQAIDMDYEYLIYNGSSREKRKICLNMIGKGFYGKWVKSSFEQFITMQTRVGSTNGWIISQNAEILKFDFSTIPVYLRNQWRHDRATCTFDMTFVSCWSAFIQ